MNFITKCTEKVPCRLTIALMIFSATFVNYMMRVNLTVNMVLMVPTANHTHSVSQVSLNWTGYEKAQVLGSFFWGYLVGSGISGPFIQLLGPKVLLSLTILINSILTLLSPVAAKYSYVAMVVLRVTIGLISGSTFPTSQALISKWAVPTEKGRFLGMLIGGSIGTFFSWTICGLIIEPFGWEWGFYVFGITGLVWVIIFWYFVYDTPEKHPGISTKELHYIQNGLSKTAKNDVKKVPPYSKILLSVPCWSLAILHFGTGWGIYFVITAAPSYLASALGFETSSTGLLSGLIYLIRSFCSFGFGYLGDFMLDKNIMSLNMLRKVGCLLSHIVSGCIVLCMAIPGLEPFYYFAMIMIAMGVNGSITVSNAANAHDLTKNYVGALSGFAVMFSSLAGIVSPFVTAFFTKDDEANDELWQPVFYTGGLVYIITGLQFLIFGSTKVQPWDNTWTEHEKKNIDVNK